MGDGGPDAESRSHRFHHWAIRLRARLWARGHPGYWGYAWYRIRVEVQARQGAALAGPADFDDAYQLFDDGARPRLGSERRRNATPQFVGAGRDPAHSKVPNCPQLANDRGFVSLARVALERRTRASYLAAY
jgi:hypothetical protein